MIKLLLKHKVFEYCIDVFFRKLNENFFNRTSKYPNVGDIYRKITCDYTVASNGEKMIHEFKNCKILKIETESLFEENICSFEFLPEGYLDTCWGYLGDAILIK